MRKRLRVALLIESSRAYGRGLLEGIARYSRLYGPWALYHDGRSLGEEAPAWFKKGWKGDGIIARIDTLAQAKVIAGAGLPTVDLRGKFELGYPILEADDEATARMAADHLLGHGFRHFAFTGFAGTNFSERRRQYFRQAIEAAGFVCRDYSAPVKPATSRTTGQEQYETGDEARLARWLMELPRPVGLMACNDVRAQQVLILCRELGIAAPEDIAVIGVDNDPLLSDLSDPPLSSVIPDTPRIGYEAAELLERMIAGKVRRPIHRAVAPLGVAVRQSSDVLAIEDREVARAIHFIRRHACDGINVADVLQQSNVSRSMLDRRFIAAVGRTPKAEILRVQLERVRGLLTETDLPLARIAERAGFEHPEYLSVVFKQKMGVTPGDYRKRIRPDGH